MLYACEFLHVIRIEHVKIKEARSRAKIIGTILTLCGALTMTLYKGPIVNLIPTATNVHHTSSNDSMNQHWVMGTVLILVGCCAWSSFYILQVCIPTKYMFKTTQIHLG